MKVIYKLYNHNEICSVSFSVYISSDELAKQTEKMYLFCFHLLMYSKSICYNHSTKWGYSILVI